MSEVPRGCVLLAQSHHGLSEGVRGLLEAAFQTVVMVADDASLLDAALRLQPDVAVVDVSLMQEGGLGWVTLLRQRCPALKLIALSAHSEESVRSAVLGAGANAFVLKREIAEELLNAVDYVRDAGSMRVSTGGEREET